MTPAQEALERARLTMACDLLLCLVALTEAAERAHVKPMHGAAWTAWKRNQVIQRARAARSEAAA